MSRTRAERRHNTRVKTSARKALKANGGGGFYYCSKVAPNGEAKSCTPCVFGRAYDRHYNEMWMKAQAKAFMMAIAE